MSEYQRVVECDLVFIANDVWKRASKHGKTLLIGPSAFMAILKLAADGDGQVLFLVVDERIDNMYWQTIAWVRKGVKLKFRTYGSLQQFADHPECKRLNLRLPIS